MPNKPIKALEKPKNVAENIVKANADNLKKTSKPKKPLENDDQLGLNL